MLQFYSQRPLQDRGKSWERNCKRITVSAERTLVFLSDSVSGVMTFPVVKNIIRCYTNQIAGRAVTEAAADRVQTRRLHEVHL